MTNWHDVERLKGDAQAARRLAKSLLTSESLTDWERSFLIDMADQQSQPSTRQAEKLLQVRDEAKRFTSIDGVSLARLLERCADNRLDLDESDEAFVLELAKRQPADFSKREASRICRCARNVGELESYQCHV